MKALDWLKAAVSIENQKQRIQKHLCPSWIGDDWSNYHHFYMRCEQRIQNGLSRFISLGCTVQCDSASPTAKQSYGLLYYIVLQVCRCINSWHFCLVDISKQYPCACMWFLVFYLFLALGSLLSELVGQKISFRIESWVRSGLSRPSSWTPPPGSRFLPEARSVVSQWHLLYR